MCVGGGGGGGYRLPNDRVVHCDVDSMDLGLLIGVLFEIGGCNVVPD